MLTDPAFWLGSLFAALAVGCLVAAVIGQIRIFTSLKDAPDRPHMFLLIVGAIPWLRWRNDKSLRYLELTGMYWGAFVLFSIFSVFALTQVESLIH